MINPYETPKSNALSSEQGIKNGSVVKAVVSAVALDFIGTLVVSFLVGAAYGMYLASIGTSQSAIIAIVSKHDLTAPNSLIAQGLGLLISYAAAHLCCKIAGNNAKKATITAASIMTLIGFILGFSAYPLWENILMSGVGLAVYYAAYRSFLSANKQPFVSQ